MNRRSFLATAGLIAGGLTAATVRQSLDAQEQTGRMLFVRDGAIWVWENGEAERVWQEEGVSDARWSPVGDSVLFVRAGNSYSDLVILNLANQVTTQLTYFQSGEQVGTEAYTQSSYWAVDPAWCRSGRIAFASDAAGGGSPLQLWIIDSLGSEPYLAPVLANEDDIDSITLSGSGEIAAYVMRERQPDGTSDTNVWLRDLNTGESFLAAQSSGEVFDPALSPDGQDLAVTIRDTEGKTDVWLVSRESLERTRVTRDGVSLSPAWSSDGRQLAYLKLVDYQFAVWAAPVRNGNPGDGRKLFEAKGLDSTSGISWFMPTQAT